MPLKPGRSATPFLADNGAAARELPSCLRIILELDQYHAGPRAKIGLGAGWQDAQHTAKTWENGSSATGGQFHISTTTTHMPRHSALPGRAERESGQASSHCPKTGGNCSATKTQMHLFALLDVYTFIVATRGIFQWQRRFYP